MSGQFHRGTGRVAMPPHTHVVFTFQQRGDLRYVDPRTFGELFVSDRRRPRQGQGAPAPGDRSARPGVHVADLPVPAGRPCVEDEAAADGPEVHRRPRQHLLRRGAVPRGHPVRPHERRACPHRRCAGCIARSRRCCRRRSSSAAPRSTTRPTSTCSATRASTGPSSRSTDERGLPCRRCRTPIETVKISQRNSFYCPQCQS